MERQDHEETGLAITLARLAHLAPKASGGVKTSLTTTVLPIAGFLVGCASGALAQGYWGLGAMIALHRRTRHANLKAQTTQSSAGEER